ncbi:hypothetical protein [uncultured Methanobrevibacter sp.]|uniref:hypothetical protein n=1 Tax=uncultured Methanobrevibacter sp. TaxID=253161 RepID=UPI00261E2BF4|nr:hypothetical protein [uncultured Methanobrevibacter sp.]
MNKKIFILILVVIIALCLIMPITSTQDFDGNFTMEVPFGSHYSNVAWCRANGALGCADEYWEENAGCDLDENEMVVYYYDDSLLGDGESNVLQYAVDDLTYTYLYEIHNDDENSLVLKTDYSMHNTPTYLVGKVNGDASKVVFVGGHNLDDLIHYANTIKFR